MTRDEYFRLKSKLANIDDALREGHLTSEEKTKLEALSAELSRQLVVPWLPAGWTRKAIMLGIFALGVYGLVEGHQWLVWSWLLALLFSPRIMGENFHFGRRDRSY